MNAQASMASHGNHDGSSPFNGLAPLMRQAFSGVDLKPLGARLIERASTHPGDAHALMDLSAVLQLTGNRDIALATQLQALQLQQIYRVPAAKETRLRLLAVMAPGDLMANTPLEMLLEQSDVTLDMLYLAPGLEALPELPDHDVLFIAIGESDQNQSLLGVLHEITQQWPRPVLNAPEKIAGLTRDGISTLLRDAPGVAIPATRRIERQLLEPVARGECAMSDAAPEVAFPIIARPVGSHAGNALNKLENAAELAAYLQAVDAPELYVASFIDYRSADGMFRKYRIILIDGQPFSCHMGISAHWMIHYLNAGMTDSAEKRAEEAAFMASFDEVFACRHAAAFKAISERVGLDYVGMDCAETPDGRLLIFEVDSDMIVHAMDPVDLFPYKQQPMQNLFAAFRAMLGKAAARGAKVCG